MFVVGVDLSGPSNFRETAAAWFQEASGKLEYMNSVVGADDRLLFELASRLASGSQVVVGLDAPLSYNTGGGDRDRDRLLRQRVIEAGLPSGTVMAPTMTRMAYLTLRGLGVARLLETIRPRAPRIVEVHPFASLALRGAPAKLLRRVKKDASSRLRVLEYLQDHGLQDVHNVGMTSDHLVAACAGALSAWDWVRGRSVWVAPAELPHHPYDFAC